MIFIEHLVLGKIELSRDIVTDVIEIIRLTCEIYLFLSSFKRKRLSLCQNALRCMTIFTLLIHVSSFSLINSS